MKKTQNTTIQISSDTKKALDSLKKYRRETYNDLIIRILDETGKTEKQPKETKKNKKTNTDAEPEQIEKKSVDPPAEQEY